MDFFVIWNFDIIFAKKFRGRPFRPYLLSQLAPTAKTSNFKCQMSPEQDNPQFCRFSCAIVHGLFGDLEFQQNFAKNFLERPLRSHLWSKLARAVKTSHFKGQMCPRAGKPQFCRFSCAIVHWLFDDLDFRHNFYQNFSWTIVKTLAREPVIPHGQNISLLRSNLPRIRQTPHFADYRVL